MRQAQVIQLAMSICSFLSGKNTQGDADYYAALNLAEAGSRYEVYSLQGAADPKIEPQDVIYVELPDAPGAPHPEGAGAGVKKVMVDEVSSSSTSKQRAARYLIWRSTAEYL